MTSAGDFLSKWIVCLAGGAIYFHHLGLLKISSYLFIGTLEQYGVNRNQAIFPYVLNTTICNLIGPIVGYLGCKFRFDHLIIFGSLLSSLGIALCFFAPNITVIILFWSVLGGIGQGFAMLTTTLISFHYKRDASVAHGITLAGSSLGGILYSIICKFFIDEYMLSGTFLLISACALHSVPAAMLLTDSRSWLKIPNGETNFNNMSTKKNENIRVAKSQNIHVEMSPCTIEDTNNEHKYTCIISHANTLPSEKDGKKQPQLVSMKINDCRSSVNNGSEEFTEQSLKNKNVKRECEFYNASKLKDISVDSKIDEKADILPQMKPSKNENQTMCSKDHPCLPAPISKPKEKTWETFRVFYDPIFIIFTFGQSTYVGLILILLATVGDYVLDKGLGLSEAAIVIISGSFAELIGRISLGWVTDKGFMSLYNFTATLYLVCALSFLGLSLSIEIYGLTLCNVLAMFVHGCIMPMYPAMISQNFEGDFKTMALTSRFILFLPTSLMISPLIGYFRENLGSYIGLYLSLAVFCGGCVLLNLSMPRILKCRRKQSNV